MSIRKARRRSVRMSERGFMVVSPHFLTIGAQASNVTPKRWLDWLARRNG